MTPQQESAILSQLRAFAASVTEVYSSQLTGDPEDQLKPPAGQFLRDAGSSLGYDIQSKTESRVTGVGRPDFAVASSGLLVGHIELKAPGTGVRKQDFKGRNKEQFEKFASLPNLIYTDGESWALYREGEREGAVVRPSGDPTSDGAGAVEESDAEGLEKLLRDFFSWSPITPQSPKALAEMLAPLCHLLRDDVLGAVEDKTSNVSSLAREWRQLLFPDADDAQFADAYAQTLTYALLLARFTGKGDLDTSSAVVTLRDDHGLLSQALDLLSNYQAREEISTAVDLLERSISAVDPGEIARRSPGGDPWLYFYEDFLAAYDRNLRSSRGVYYTPAQVVQAQVNLVSRLLVDRFDKQFSYAEEDVTILDPATGTGTYPLAAIQHGLDLYSDYYGQGMTGAGATQLAKNVHAFELLVGPYAVTHLRLSERILDAGGSLPADGVRAYLTDTLESPHANPPDRLPLAVRELAREHERALEVKKNARVLVCIGNPPYDRQQIDPEEEGTERKGGWVRTGDHGPETALFEDFLAPARRSGAGGHLKNLYNDYVYFWRWALWKIFEDSEGPGIVSFITASSYLRGPGFVGMRELMRSILDELWIIDLEGDNLGARKTENVFDIRTPVAIAVGVRYGDPDPTNPAHIRYVRVEGTREQKLATLADVQTFEDLQWHDGMSGWQEPFLPQGEGDYYSWPLLTDIFPWQQPGVKVGRKWPQAVEQGTLTRRWDELISAETTERRRTLFKDSPTGRKLEASPPRSLPRPASDQSLSSVGKETPQPPIVRCAYRSLDRQWMMADSRLIDRASPPLWQAHSARQVYMTSLLTGVLGTGPAVSAAEHIPDLHHFRGSFGGKDVTPLWRDAAASEPNVTTDLLYRLSEEYGHQVGAEELFAYVYAVLACRSYTEKFSEELLVPGPRLPLTKDHGLFERGARLGRELIFLHTYGERFAEDSKARLPRGKAQNTKPIPDSPASYPESYEYDPVHQSLRVGEGEIRPVNPWVWEYEVSGLRVLNSWLAYRKKEPYGRTSSPLDKIGPEGWTGQMTRELLELIWVLEATVEKEPELQEFLETVTDSDLFTADELPQPTSEERDPPKDDSEPQQLSL